MTKPFQTFNRLVILSGTPHYRTASGEVAGWGPTVVENDYIAGFFSSVRVLGFLHPGAPPAAARTYENPKITFVSLKPSGGSGLPAKMNVLWKSLGYLSVIRRECRNLNAADWVYVRCPCNVGLLALLFLSFNRVPKRWFKYAGNWKPRTREAWSYSLQRLLLRKHTARGPVTINGRWKGQPKHVLSFLNPSFQKKDLDIILSERAETRTLRPPYELLFAGRLEREKGIYRLLEIAGILNKRGLAFHLHLAGEGKDESDLKRQIRQKALSSHLIFHGSLSREDLGKLYRKAHLFLFPSTASEGWPKVLSESMGYGCVPVASNISSIPQIIESFGCGLALPQDNPQHWADSIENILKNENQWKLWSKNGAKAAAHFTYEHMADQLRERVLQA